MKSSTMCCSNRHLQHSTEVCRQGGTLYRDVITVKARAAWVLRDQALCSMSHVLQSFQCIQGLYCPAWVVAALPSLAMDLLAYKIQTACAVRHLKSET
jgi:hypothetical protein